MKIFNSHGVLFSKTCQGLITQDYRDQTSPIFPLPIPPSPQEKAIKFKTLSHLTNSFMETI